MDEQGILLRSYARAQARCSDALTQQAQEIARLQAEAVRLRAAAIVRDSALHWEREDRLALERSIPGLPKRAALARHVDMLLGRLQDLLRARPLAERQRPQMARAPLVIDDDMRHEDPEALEASLRAADVVICRTGCLSHGAYWRVQDHCKRTGKTCVMVDAPASLRIVEVHRRAPVNA